MRSGRARPKRHLKAERSTSRQSKPQLKSSLLTQHLPMMPMPPPGIAERSRPSILSAFCRRDRRKFMTKVAISFTLNGQDQSEFIDAGSTLLTVLRGKLGMYSTKAGCHQGTCGACTVIIDREPHLACLTLAERCRGRSITTLEGLTRDGALHPLQQAFIAGFAAQCGFCTPGMVLAAKSLLDRNPHTSRSECH